MFLATSHSTSTGSKHHNVAATIETPKSLTSRPNPMNYNKQITLNSRARTHQDAQRLHQPKQDHLELQQHPTTMSTSHRLTASPLTNRRSLNKASSNSNKPR
ncbi:hypothetical protein Droror1_Dr00013595 [Drosera rotundifolia]